MVFGALALPTPRTTLIREFPAASASVTHKHLVPLRPPSHDSETTSSACFTYGIAYGINAGILPAAEYTPVVAAAWAGLASISLQPSGLVGWCQPEGGGPGPANQNGTSPFCVGQFLLAASQVLQLAQA